ncbi:hypothetical protein AGLY_010786 [Aphis glycines]|uniref:Uncharacterized protein n=1 Tax=Aphis glycines TaxID=307491 RepID=A0A6G0TFV7_APHGL|nr:hypothetical protein AGLY_010786 [Aphis glycines]
MNDVDYGCRITIYSMAIHFITLTFIYLQHYNQLNTFLVPNIIFRSKNINDKYIVIHMLSMYQNNYHIDYQNYPIQLESETENVTDSLKINENNNSSNTMEVDEKTQNDIIEKKKNNYEENVLDWCRSHSMTANTHFIKKKKKKLDEVPHKFRLELEMDFIRAVLIAEGYTSMFQF